VIYLFGADQYYLLSIINAKESLRLWLIILHMARNYLNLSDNQWRRSSLRYHSG
jgi:hypothetical protein